MLEREKKGEIQWQRAVMNTMQILRKAGISQSEASKTATLIQVITPNSLRKLKNHF